jgi:hypothetical protein
MKRPAKYRLAFRELGLAIGLRGLPIIREALQNERSVLSNKPSLVRIIGTLLRYETLSDEIVDLWLPYAEGPDDSWKAHRDINEMMLATALAPISFLSIGE